MKLAVCRLNWEISDSKKAAQYTRSITMCSRILDIKFNVEIGLQSVAARVKEVSM